MIKQLLRKAIMPKAKKLQPTIDAWKSINDPRNERHNNIGNSIFNITNAEIICTKKKNKTCVKGFQVIENEFGFTVQIIPTGCECIKTTS